jgi:hypothetical protein
MRDTDSMALVDGRTIKRDKIIGIQGIGRAPAKYPGIALVKFKIHTAINPFLGGVNECI